MTGSAKPQVHLVAGLDEVGRGCLAGPVIAAAVVFPGESFSVPGVADSKTLSPNRREKLAKLIEDTAVAFSIGRAEVSEIDRMNILEATLLAMRRAFCALPVKPDAVLVDGNRYPSIACPGRAVVGGDRIVPAISAASVMAKVFRDREMGILEGLYPGYEFAVNKGYATRRHRIRLQDLGPSPAHRRSFGPVRRLLECRDVFVPTQQPINLALK